MDRMPDVMAVISIVLIVLVLISVRRAHIRVEYSVSWLTAAVLLLALSRSHTLLARMTQWLGVQDAALAVLTLAGGIFLIVLYRLSLVISRLKDSNVALVQRLAILEYRLQTNDEETKTPTRNQD